MGRRMRERAGDDAPKTEAAEAPAEVTEPKAPEAPQAEAFSVEKKIAEIKASNLPEAEKEAYIRRLTGDVSTDGSNRVPFTVYANVKKISRERRAGMLRYPKARGVTAATFAEWDEIFKGF